jgi:hypothetical protein
LQSAGPAFVKVLQTLIDNAGLAAETADAGHPSAPNKSRKETPHG